MIEEIFEKEFEKKGIFKNRDALSPHYVPSSLPYRERQIEELSKTLAPVLSGRKPENVFIYGKTGTGKTVVAKYVLNKLEEFAERRDLPVKSVYVNCRVHNTRHRVFVKIAEVFYPEDDFRGLSASYVYDRILKAVDHGGIRTIIVLDEVDKLNGVSDVVYALNRANDELSKGSISLVGISNNVSFREDLDPRTKSTLCQHEMVFPPYNAQELRKILGERAAEGFKEGAVEESAISFAAALAANHSGDARYGLLLLLRAGEIAEEEGSGKVEERHVKMAVKKVEEDIILELVSTLPEHERIALYALAKMFKESKGIKVFGGDTVVTSGDAYGAYAKIAQELGKTPVSDRWFREYLSELEMYGIISVASSGKGFRGQTRVLKLNYDPEKVIKVTGLE